MKKKLTLGMGLVTLIFILSGVVVVRNLNVITSSQEFKDGQEAVLDRYSEMFYEIRNAQSELYRHQAGYSRDVNSLVEHVLALEGMLLRTKNEYAGHLNRAVCNDCHALPEKIDTLNRMLDAALKHLNAYMEKISLIITSGDQESTAALEKEAAGEGNEIMKTVAAIRHATAKMNGKMEERIIASVARSRQFIYAAFVAAMLLSAAVVVVTIRSVTGPVDILVKGIENVSAGDYSSKVAVTSHDEIGFLAQSFNRMTDNLHRVTGQKEGLMKQLQDLNSELERRVDEATEELRTTHEKMLRNETLSTVGTFAAGVAHELATPLSSIASYFRMLRERMPEELSEDADLIESELGRCRNVLRSMLNFARAPEREKTLTNVNEVLRELMAFTKYHLEYRKISIREELDPDLPGIMSVPSQLKQVFMNIMVNAFQAMSGEGELTVLTSCEHDNKRIVVSISDTGPGIPEDQLNRIFQPFYTTKKSGTGLGLSVSYGIVKAHGGEIEVSSEPGKGTAFTVFLPAAA